MNVLDQASGQNWTLYQGDSCEIIRGMPDNSIDLSVYSPPFANLYIYSDSVADMGNAADEEEFFQHYSFLIKELHRVTVPGRLSAVHCKDLPLYKNRDGAAGLKDFPGMIIREHEKHGWVYHSRVTIFKDPVIEMQRTKTHGLLYKNLRERGEVVRQGMADYLLVFRKWEGVENTESTKPVLHTREGFPLEMWQRYASPVWFDINQTRVLNYQIARDNQDEKHICPLQLDVIERSIELWTNPGDVVFSPFAGIGSEPFCAVKMGRKGLGVELKKSYFDIAVKNLQEAERLAAQVDLFSFAGIEVEGVA
jgi:DNA modification methylase